MITTISKQGGRRYPQMRSGWSAHQWLPSVGETTVAATITGRWSDIERIRTDRTRQAIHADRGRIEVRG